MSIKYEIKEVFAPRKVFVEKCCDICRSKAYSEYTWERGKYDDIKISRLVSSYYPEGDFRKNISLDMCPVCWCEKFVPWVESLGGKFTVVENEDGEPSDMKPD